jgi:hypothetical protein
VLSFTGGEPVLHRDALAALSRLAIDSGLEVGVVTNAYWADSPARAGRVLDRLSHVARFDVSTDARHVEFVPLTRVIHAVDALRDRGQMGTIRFARQPGDDGLLDEVRALLGRRGLVDRLHVSTLVPLDAMGQPTLPEERRTTQAPVFPCMAMAPVATPSGRVVACCGPLSFLPQPHALVLGDLRRDSLGTILERRANNPFVQALRISGVVGLQQLVRELGLGDAALPAYDSESVCYACFHLVSRLPPELPDAVPPRIRARLAMSRFVVFGEADGIDALQPGDLEAARLELRSVATEGRSAAS